MFDSKEAQAEEDRVYGIGGEDRLVAVNPRITPESSPEPASKPVSPSTSKSGESAKRRRKALPSKGDAYLLRTAFPNATEVTRRAEHHLPNGESGDEMSVEGEDVADMDERLALSMEKAEKDKERDAEEERRRGEEDKARQIEIAAKALHLSTPTQQPSPSEPMDLDTRMNDAPGEVPHQKPNGLGIHPIKSEYQHPVPGLVTPVEPRFAEHESAFTNSPFSPIPHRNSVDWSEEKLPAMNPLSPEGPMSPSNERLPPLRSIMDMVDSTNRQRTTSLSMGAPSPMTNGPYRSSFSGSIPSPGLMLDTTSPRSTLALSPPSAFLGPRRESYPSVSSANTNESYASSDVTSPNTLPTPQSDHRPSVDETNSRTLPLPHPDLAHSALNIGTITAGGPGGFKCDFPGCSALPFQTSYLLK